MDDEDANVAMSRWRCAPGPVAVAHTTGLIGAFAGDHGMRGEDRTALSLAVSQVLACAAGDEGREPEATVDAATDGEWLTVWVRGALPARTDAAPALAAAIAASERVDWVADHDAVLTVVMEFPIASDRLL